MYDYTAQHATDWDVVTTWQHWYVHGPQQPSRSGIDYTRTVSFSLRTCQDSVTQNQSRAKWPLGFCVSLNKSHFGEEYVPLDFDAVQYPGVWIKWLQIHQWLPSAQWVMLVNSAIRCIVNSCYLSLYSSWVWWQRPPSCQALAPSREHFISQRDDSYSDRAEEFIKCLVKSPCCTLTLKLHSFYLWLKNLSILKDELVSALIMKIYLQCVRLPRECLK